MSILLESSQSVNIKDFSMLTLLNANPDELSTLNELTGSCAVWGRFSTLLGIRSYFCH